MLSLLRALLLLFESIFGTLPSFLDCNVLNFCLLHCNLYANQPLMSILANPIQKETNLAATEQIHEMKDANILSAGLWICVLEGGLNYSEEVLGDYSGAAWDGQCQKEGDKPEWNGSQMRCNLKTPE